MLNNYTRVRLLTDAYQDEGAHAGDVGYIIEVYGNGDYEVEFSDKGGITYAQIVAHEEELEVADLRPGHSGTFTPESHTISGATHS